ncbi:hypothetical protein IJG14_00875 [bacterium]|nr:hypothetical protein [bacterium]
MSQEEFNNIKPKHTLSAINKALCRLVLFMMIIMFISYYFTTVMEVKLTKLSSETMKLNNENIELQNKLDNLMSYHNVEELVRKTGKLNTARQVIEIDTTTKIQPKKTNKKNIIKNYYRWSLGF